METRRVDPIPANYKHQQELAYDVLMQATSTGRELPKVQASPSITKQLTESSEEGREPIAQVYNQGKIGLADETTVPEKDNTLLFTGLGLGTLFLLNSGGKKPDKILNAVVIAGTAYAAWKYYQKHIKDTQT